MKVLLDLVGLQVLEVRLELQEHQALRALQDL